MRLSLRRRRTWLLLALGVATLAVALGVLFIRSHFLEHLKKREDFEQIEFGMTKAEVEEILGPPDSVLTIDSDGNGSTEEQLCQPAFPGLTVFFYWAEVDKEDPTMRWIGLVTFDGKGFVRKSNCRILSNNGLYADFRR
jgi:hypothetical protein